MDIPKFSPEVLSIIFFYLYDIEQGEMVIDKKSLAQCSLTSRSWTGPAQEMLFTDITLVYEKDVDRLFFKVLKDDDKLGKRIKVLRFFGDCYVCSTSTLLSIALLLPNLEKLVFNSTDSSYFFFCKLLTENGKFNKMKTIPTPKSREQISTYLNCLDYMKEKIVSIELYDDNNYNNNDNEGDNDDDEENEEDEEDEEGEEIEDEMGDNNNSAGIDHNLSVYKKLKNVAIRVPYNEVDLDYVIPDYFETIIEKNNGQLLQHLFIAPSTGDPFSYLSLSTPERALLPSNALKKIRIFKHSCVRLGLNEKFMLFIMKKFPNLNNLMCVEKNPVNYCCGTIFPSESYTEITLHFLQFVNKMQNCFFRKVFVSSMSNTIDLVKEFYTSSLEEEHLIIPSTIVRALKIKHNSCFTRLEQDYTEITFEKNSKVQSIKLSLIKGRTDPEIPRESLFMQQDLKLLDPVRKIGPFVQQLSLEIILIKSLPQIFNHIVRYCKLLNNLVISNIFSWKCKEIFECKKEAVMKISSVESLTLVSCMLSQEQISHIVNQFPNLDTLKLDRCFFHAPIIVGQPFSLIGLPMLSLEYMEIRFRISYLDDREKHYINLVTRADQKDRYCFLKANHSNDSITGYSLIENPTESTFQDSILNQENNAIYLIRWQSIK